MLTLAPKGTLALLKCLKLLYAFGALIDNQSRKDFQSLSCQYVEGIEKPRLYEPEAGRYKMAGFLNFRHFRHFSSL